MTRTARPSPDESPRPVDEQKLLARLLASAAGRDESAFSRLYDLTKRRVYGLALAICRDANSADDATLETFTQIWRTAETFDPARGDAWTWILSIARSRCLDLLRSRARHAARRQSLDTCADKACGSTTPESTCLGAESARQVREAVGRLPSVQREAIQTAYFGGLSYSETAAALGVPVGTVKTRIRAALCELRRALGTEEEEGPQ